MFGTFFAVLIVSAFGLLGFCQSRLCSQCGRLATAQAETSKQTERL